MSLDTVTTREEAMDFLEGYAAERKEELDGRRTTAGLVKSYLLETVPQGSHQPELGRVFASVGGRLDRLDGTMSKVWDSSEKRHVGLLEELLPRHPVFYSNEDAKLSDAWVGRLVSATPFLDRLWLSGWTLNQLWDKVLQLNPGHRYGRLAFQHENWFEVDAQNPEEDDVDDGETTEEQQPGVRIQEAVEGEETMPLLLVPWDPDVDQTGAVAQRCRQVFCQRVLTSVVTQVGKLVPGEQVEVEFDHLLNAATFNLYERWRIRNREVQRSLRRFCGRLLHEALGDVPGVTLEALLGANRHGRRTAVADGQAKEAAIESITRCARGPCPEIPGPDPQRLPFPEDE